MLGDVRRSSLSAKRCSSGAKAEGKKPSYVWDGEKEQQRERNKEMSKMG